MKLVRFGHVEEERPGVWLDDVPTKGDSSILDVRAMAFDIEDYNEHFFSHNGLERLVNLLREGNRKLIPADGVRLGPPIARSSKIICLGANYAEHARECHFGVSDNPILFTKATTAVIGPFDPVVLPEKSKIVDSEAELAVVIGNQTRNVSCQDAMDAVAGYMVLNDVTDREAQSISTQWFRGKSPDTFCPIGPYLVTRDEIENPHNLRITSKINGVVIQEGHTSDMIFNIPFLISFISATITLLPGDVISTGTPAGIGSLRKPPVFLKSGDCTEIIVEHVGHQISPVKVEG